MAICLTAGEQSENHVGMKINGNGLSDNGFSNDELLLIQKKLLEKEISSNYYCIGDTNEDKAGLLIIKNGLKTIFNIDPNELYKEQLTFEWDKKYWDRRRQKVLNKHARYNVCYGTDFQEPNYENGKGTIISYEKVPLLNKWKSSLGILFGEKANDLEVEGNYYYNTKKCGIGFHGDSERRKVIACSLGESRPIHWQWYQYSKPIGERIKFTLDNGVMYIMSEKTTGYDWKKRNIKTLRHAAGTKYVK